jgi:transcriptional regulator with XRE-family HTH domain
MVRSGIARSGMAEELGGFLKLRRGRLRPEDVGLAAHGRRRVPGLRREEVAQLAGVSTTHYTRLEQGSTDYVSDDVLHAIAGALRLTDHERAYLCHLARGSRNGSEVPDEPPKLRPGLVDLLESLVHVPAAIVGHHTEVLGCNQLCVELLGRLPATESEGIFLDEGLRRRIAPSWDIHAWHNVAFLRASLARRPHDQRLRDHVAAMRSRSEEFDELWRRHDVVDWTYGEGYLVIDHPVVGRLTLSYEHLQFPGDPDIYGMQVWTASAGTPERAALSRLADRCGRAPSPIWVPTA